MMDTLITTIQKEKSPLMQQQLLREALQHLILQEMDRMGAFSSLCFVGGTALRILYGLQRFSEDLDFSLLSKDHHPDTPMLLQTLAQKTAALEVNLSPLKVKTKGAVVSTFFSFRGLLYQVNPKAFRKDQLLSIKVEIDTHPPQGGRDTSSAVSGQRLYSLRHYTLPSLFAGKLHALLCRAYTKGRDLYDFFWYTAKKTPANMALLTHALEQTEKKIIPLTNSILHQRLQRRAEEYDFKKAREEMARFLINQEEVELLTKEQFLAQIPRVELVEER